MYAGNPREAADQVAGAREGRPRHRLGGRGLRLRLPHADGLPGRQDRDASRSASAILNIYSRTPSALLADGGRPRQRLPAAARSSASAPAGPQVIEGFHGVPYDKPLGRTHEIIELIRRGSARARRWRTTGIFTLPLPAGPGHRPRQAAQDHQPSPSAPTHPDLRRRARPQERRAAPPRSPTAGCRSCSSPRRRATSGATRSTPGTAKRAADLGPLEICAGGMVAIGEDP